MSGSGCGLGGGRVLRESNQPRRTAVFSWGGGGASRSGWFSGTDETCTAFAATAFEMTADLRRGGAGARQLSKTETRPFSSASPAQGRAGGGVDLGGRRHRGRHDVGAGTTSAAGACAVAMAIVSRRPANRAVNSERRPAKPRRPRRRPARPRAGPRWSRPRGRGLGDGLGEGLGDVARGIASGRCRGRRGGPTGSRTSSTHPAALASSAVYQVVADMAASMAASSMLAFRPA